MIEVVDRCYDVLTVMFLARKGNETIERAAISSPSEILPDTVTISRVWALLCTHRDRNGS